LPWPWPSRPHSSGARTGRVETVSPLRVGPKVRIRLPPAGSLQTFGPSGVVAIAQIGMGSARFGERSHDHSIIRGAAADRPHGPVLYTAYFDEADTHGRAPTIIMAGFLGSAPQWEMFNRAIWLLQAYSTRLIRSPPAICRATHPRSASHCTGCWSSSSAP
jgi:hypothetical protein